MQRRRGSQSILIERSSIFDLPEPKPTIRATPKAGVFASNLFMKSIVAHPSTGPTLQFPSAVDSRVGWRLPSEGKGHTSESCRARQFFLILQRDIRARTETPAPRHSSE